MRSGAKGFKDVFYEGRSAVTAVANFSFKYFHSWIDLQY